MDPRCSQIADAGKCICTTPVQFLPLGFTNHTYSAAFNGNY